MSIQFANKLEPEKIEQEIENSIKKMKLQLSLVLPALEIIKTFEGKQITKRIATKIQENELFKLYTVSYDTNFGMFHINIWGNNIPYDSRIRMLIGYDNNPFINKEKVCEFNLCYTLNEERFRSAEKLTSTKLKTLVNKFNKGLELMQEAHKEAEDYYGLEYKIDLGIK